MKIGLSRSAPPGGQLISDEPIKELCIVFWTLVENESQKFVVRVDAPDAASGNIKRGTFTARTRVDAINNHLEHPGGDGQTAGNQLRFWCSARCRFIR